MFMKNIAILFIMSAIVIHCAAQSADSTL